MDAGPFKLAQISFIMLGVEKVAGSKAFYCEKLGLAVKFEFEAFVFLDGGGVTLMLSESLGRAAKPLAGATEIVFGVSEVRAAHRALAARGIVFTQEPRQVTPTDWAANFYDPDGHRLSVYGPEGK